MKKERKLDRLYAEFEKDYSGKSIEEMDKIISDLEKEIDGKENALKSLEAGEKRENLEKSVEQAKNRLQNLKGYTKNRSQIEAIIKYRDLLIKKKDEHINKKAESYKVYNEALRTYREVTKKLADEKYTITLDGDQYNALLQQQADSKKEMNNQAKIYNYSKAKIIELETKISKCNLAWKTLFVNKDWDEIHKIALNDEKRFTRTVETNKPDPVKVKKQETQKDSKESEEKIQKVISENVNAIINKEKQPTVAEKVETTALVEKKENFFKRMWKKFVKWLEGEDEEKETTSEEKTKKSSETIKDKKEDDKEKVESKTTKQERDAFLDGLRQHVDLDYRESVKKEKEKAYIEQHRAQAKEDSR